MIQIAESSNGLDILSPMPRGTRILFALLAVFPLIAPYELIWRVQWTDYWTLFFLFAAIISAGALALSAILVFSAVAGLSSRMTFDTASFTLTYAEGAPVVPLRTRVLPLSSVGSVQVRTHDWSDGAPSYALTIRMSDGAAFDSGSSWSHEEIDQAKLASKLSWSGKQV
jgi:hypothetical protein